MAVTYGFYDSLSGDRLYNASQMGRMFQGLIADGIYATVGGGLVVSPNSGMNIIVASGRAWILNTWTYNDANLGLTVQASEVALNRIDTVVVEVNTDVGTRANAIKIVKGTPASSPVPPTLSDTATLKQMALADIYVGAGVTSINAGNITNRVGTAGSPFVTGVIETLDLATVLGRFESDVLAWFANLQNELDSNQAANLQNQIDGLTTRSNFGWIPVSDTWSFAGSEQITVPSDATLKYKKWMRVRFKQGGAYKYFVCKSVAATQLNVWAGGDNIVSNAAITDVWYSLVDSPYGYPVYYNFPIAGNIVVGTGATLVARVSITTSGFVNGHVEIQLGTSPTVPANAQIICPVAPSGYGMVSNPVGLIRMKDANGSTYTGVMVMSTASNVLFLAYIDASGTYATTSAVNSTTPFTWVATDEIEMNFSYFA